MAGKLRIDPQFPHTRAHLRRRIGADSVGFVNLTESRLIRYYEESNSEQERLTRREGKLELARTRILLERLLPPPPARIIDIGGGTGVHADWLVAAGYSVHLVDVVPAHVQHASEIKGVTAAVGDARMLREPEASFDVALLLGPLYHLPEREDRIRAVSEARRVVRDGGMVVAAVISRSAALLDAIAKGWIDRPGAMPLIVEHLQGGSAPSSPRGFSSVAYFHWPEEARAELELCALDVLAMVGVEGAGWLTTDFDERWESQEHRDLLMEIAALSDAHPELLVLSSHLLAFCRTRPA